MATQSAAGDTAREFLAGLPEFKAGDKPVGDLSDAYANRLARRAQADLAAGRAPSRQAARGHVLTPEHPGGSAPKLPEPPREYTVNRLAEPRIIHNRPPSQPPVGFGADGQIYSTYSQREALQLLRFARDTAGPSQPWGRDVQLVVFDCSQGKYLEVFHHGHGRGIPAGVLLDQYRESGTTFEQFLMNIIAGRKSDITFAVDHICVYGITIMPTQAA